MKAETLAAWRSRSNVFFVGTLGRLCRDVDCHGTSFPWIVFLGSQIESHWSTLVTYLIDSRARPGHKPWLVQTCTAMDTILMPILLVYYISGFSLHCRCYLSIFKDPRPVSELLYTEGLNTNHPEFFISHSALDNGEQTHLHSHQILHTVIPMTGRPEKRAGARYPVLSDFSEWLFCLFVSLEMETTLLGQVISEMPALSPEWAVYFGTVS